MPLQEGLHGNRRGDRGQRLVDHAEGAAQFLLGDDERRLHAQHIGLLATHADQYAALAAESPHGSRLGRRRLLASLDYS